VSLAGRLVRLAVTLAIATVASGGFAAAHTETAAGATPSPTPTSSNAPHRVSITLDTLDPKAVQPHDTLVVAGTVTNISGSALTSVSVAVRASTHRIDTRYDLTREADPANVLGSTVSNTRLTLGSLGVDQTMSWQISLPVDRLDLPSSPADFGAYPFAVDVRSTSAGSTLTTRLPTTLMWMPAGSQLVQTQIS
jgi:uncharacterized protein DUF6049